MADAAAAGPGWHRGDGQGDGSREPSMKTPPSPTDPNGGRDLHGRFAPGNRAAVGNPYATRIAKLRSALLGAVTDDDVRKVIKALVKEAKAGNIPAVKELFDRTLGKPVEADLIERLE